MLQVIYMGNGLCVEDGSLSAELDQSVSPDK